MLAVEARLLAMSRRLTAARQACLHYFRRRRRRGNKIASRAPRMAEIFGAPALPRAEQCRLEFRGRFRGACRGNRARRRLAGAAWREITSRKLASAVIACARKSVKCLLFG